MMKLVLLLIYLAASATMAALSVPLMLGWIGPNRWYGFRTRRTLADLKVWYPANAVAGKYLCGAALTISLGAIGFYFVPGWQLEHYALANLAVTLFSVGYAVLQSARSLKKPKELPSSRE